MEASTFKSSLRGISITVSSPSTVTTVNSTFVPSSETLADCKNFSLSKSILIGSPSLREKANLNLEGSSASVTLTPLIEAFTCGSNISN